MLVAILVYNLYSRLISKTLKINIDKVTFYPLVLYGSAAWSLILEERHRLGVVKNW